MKHYLKLTALLWVPIALFSSGIDLSGLTEDTEESSPAAPVKFQHEILYPDGTLQQTETVIIQSDGKQIVHGPTERYRKDGTLEASGQMVLGKRHGQWTLYLPGGTKKIGHFQNGKESGLWKSYDCRGQLTKEAHYFDGTLHGTSQTLRNDGSVLKLETYVGGKLQGPLIETDEIGVRRLEAHYLNGYKHGPFIRRHKNGTQLVSGHFFMGVPTDQWQWSDEEGKTLASFDMKRGTGLFREFEMGPDGPYLSKTIEYKHGSKNGEEKHFSHNGLPLLEANFLSGEMDGPFLSWYDNGALKTEHHYHQGKRVKTSYTFHPSAPMRISPPIERQTIHEEDGSKSITEFSLDQQMERQYSTISDLRNNRYQEYHPNGELKREGEYTLGLKTGTWNHFYPNGGIKLTEQWTHGRLNGVIEEWYPPESAEKRRRKTQGEYVHGMREGMWVSWTPNGELSTSQQYENGLKQGAFIEYWPGQEKKAAKVEGEYTHGQKHGVWITRYPSGKIARKELWAYDQRHGSFTFYYEENHTVRARGSYHMGQPAGTLETFYPNGAIESRQTFTSGKLDGIVQGFYPDGKLRTTIHYRKGKQHGEQVQYTAQGLLESRQHYREGLRDGPIDINHPGTSYAAIRGHYKKGLPEGKWKWYGKKGRQLVAESQFTHGTGVMYEFSPHGQKRREYPLVNGVQHGLERSWEEDGTLKVEADHANGTLNGMVVEYHPNGAIHTQSQWINGQRQGAIVVRQLSGLPQMTASYHDNLLHGNAKEFFENGQLRSDGSWDMGVRNGTWTWYNELGEAVFKLNFDSGILISSETSEDSNAS